MTFCSDFEATDVDSSIGSGAVAICALYDQCHDVELVFIGFGVASSVRWSTGILSKTVQQVVLAASRQWLPSFVFHLFNEVISNAAQISFIVY